MSLTKTRALIWLTLIWLAVRIYPAVMGWSSLPACGEVVAARKLLEVGFLRAQGAQLYPTVLYGTVAHPEHYVFSHNPYLPLWSYAALYYCFGFAGVSAAVYLLKYAALILCFLVLERCFSRSAAFGASVLYALAPLFILCDGSSNAVVLASIFWPIGLALLVFRLHRKEHAGPADVLLAGATTFLAGQTCYFGLSIAPSLAVISRRLTSLRPRALCGLVTDPISLAFLGGAVLSLLVWLGQVALYEGGLGPLTDYALNKAAASPAGAPKLYIMGLVPVRIGFFVGLALAFASLLGCVYLAKDTRLAAKQPVVGIALYFILFGAMALLAPSAFVQENHFYAYLVFPGTVMAALLFDQAGPRVRKLLLLLGVFGVVLTLLYASVPIAGSPTSRYLGKLFATHSKTTDFIFTNINPPGPPFRASDVGGGQSTKVFADRFITYKVLEPERLCLASDLISEDSKFLYWRLRSLPVSPALESELASKGKLLNTLTLSFPETKETLLERLRAEVWYSVMKKAKRPERQPGPSSGAMDIYELGAPAIRLQEPTVH